MNVEKIGMKGGRGPIPQGSFEETEQQIGVCLPKALYTLVKDHDHGYPEVNYFKFIYPGQSKITVSEIGAFLSFYSWSLEGMLINYCERPEHFPQSELFVPFAITSNGDYLLLFYEYGKEESHPKVYLWAHEYYDSQGGLVFLAKDLESFLSQLYTIEDEVSGNTIKTKTDESSCLAPGNEENITAISAHIEQYIGPISFVIHEIISHDVHIDIHVVAPTSERNYYTLVTSGMSDLPMTVPSVNGQPPELFCELLLCLPPEWKLKENDWKDIRNYWPIQQLGMLAKYPHANKTWLWEGHTVGSSDAQKSFAPDTKLCAWLIGFPRSFSEKFPVFNPKEDKTIIFYAAYPVYEEEINYKLKHGAEALEDLMQRSKVTELVDIHRKNLVKSSFFNRILQKWYS